MLINLTRQRSLRSVTGVKTIVKRSNTEMSSFYTPQQSLHFVAPSTTTDATVPCEYFLWSRVKAILHLSNTLCIGASPVCCVSIAQMPNNRKCPNSDLPHIWSTWWRRTISQSPSRGSAKRRQTPRCHTWHPAGLPLCPLAAHLPWQPAPPLWTGLKAITNEGF